LGCASASEIANKMKYPERETIVLEIKNCLPLNLGIVNLGGVRISNLVENTVEMLLKLSEEVAVQG
jgi:hypothetical protein